MGAAVRLPLGAAVTSPGQARHETDEQLDALRVERGGKCTMHRLAPWRAPPHDWPSGSGCFGDRSGIKQLTARPPKNQMWHAFKVRRRATIGQICRKLIKVKSRWSSPHPRNGTDSWNATGAQQEG